VKFCRFELVAESGVIRTGIAYEGRIYETDGTNAIGIHEAADIRLLAPIGRAPSVRVYRPRELVFEYAHPAAMLGPNERLPMPVGAERLGYTPALAVVVASSGRSIDSSIADETVLGLALTHLFTTLRDPGGRALDAGYAVGPALVTPDELIESSTKSEHGAIYQDEIALSRNGVEIDRWQLADIFPRPAAAIAVASESRELTEGDLLLIPIGDAELAVDPADEIRVWGAKLGSLNVRIG
jgi:2-keto-4-pentenoate hydratase/2-oxohepta-3-ene-1,7-dioic acid hydratase in catechol pathway